MMIRTTLLIVAAVLLMSGPVLADGPSQRTPASCLVFPHYSSADGAGTVITLTNTSTDVTDCDGSDFRGGDIAIRFQYFDASDSTQVFTRHELLTPADTLGVIAEQHNPVFDSGFLVVTAVDPADWFRNVDFDFLTGSALVISAPGNIAWDYTPYAFRGVPDPSDPCARLDTDADGDATADFDSVEYSNFPKELVLDSFFEESTAAGNSITLMTTSGSRYISQIDLIFLNNEGSRFHRSFSFMQWWNGTLSDISSIALDLNGDAQEFAPTEVGWVWMEGDRIVDLAGNPVPNESGGNSLPPLLGVFAQIVSGRAVGAGLPLHFKGEIDGLEIAGGNGDPQRNGG